MPNRNSLGYCVSHGSIQVPPPYLALGQRYTRLYWCICVQWTYSRFSCSLKYSWLAHMPLQAYMPLRGVFWSSLGFSSAATFKDLLQHPPFILWLKLYFFWHQRNGVYLTVVLPYPFYGLRKFFFFSENHKNSASWLVLIYLLKTYFKHWDTHITLLDTSLTHSTLF